MVDPTIAPLAEALLAQALKRNDLIDGLGRLQPAHFPDPALGALWEAMQSMRAEGRAVSRVTLRSLVAPDALTGETVLDRIARAEGMDDPNQLADAILEHSQRVRVAKLAAWLSQTSLERSITLDAVLARMGRELDIVASERSPTDGIGWDVRAQADDLLAHLDADVPSVPFGIASVDRLAHGLSPATLTIVAGRPAMGKSALLVSICRRAASAGHGVLAFSLEMTRNQWLTRMACELTRSTDTPVKVEDAIRHRWPTANHRRRFDTAIKALGQLPLKVDDTRGMTLAEIQRRTRRARTEFEATGRKLDLVIVDQLGNVAPSDRYKGARYLEVGEATLGLRNLGKQENAAMLVAHQINRGVEGRDDKRPRLSDLRESGNIEQDADVVMLLYREAYYAAEKSKEADDSLERAVAQADAERAKDEVEIIVAKQRHGATGSVTIWTDLACNAYADLSHCPHPRAEVVQ